MKLIRKSQSATEYAIFIAAVLVGLLALQVYYSRAVKGNVKTRADSVGEQLNSDAGVINNLETRSVGARTSVTGYNNVNAPIGGTYSKSTIDDTSANTDDFAGVIQGVGAKSAVTANGNDLVGGYGGTGGEATSTAYVKEFGDGAQKLGTSTSITTATFNATPKSVWDDSGIK